MRRACAAPLLLLFALGCGPAAKPNRATFSRPASQPAFSVGLLRIHFADEISAKDRRLAEEAIRAHEVIVYHDLHFAVTFHLGGSWPSRSVDIFVHPGVTLGSRYMAEIPGRLDPDGTVHVVLGRCSTVPDLVHTLSHAWWAPLEDHSTAPAFWTEVLDRQERSVRFLKIARGCQ